ncbi:MAG: hypothetical protein PHV77_01140 [Candidatus Omnitrophica bacterium]|jgi:type II secretory pathway pseudopilin PulG|nr:hypothetical protein [Candidatus Omnitrophota bacterium]
MNYRKGKGFLGSETAITLIEFLLVAMLIAVVFAAGISASVSMLSFLKSESKETVITEDLANVLEYIKKDAIRADIIDVSIPNEVTFNFQSEGVDYEMRYWASSGILYRSSVLPSAADTPITDLIDSSKAPVFELIGGNYLQANIWLKDTATGAIGYGRAGAMSRCKAIDL